MKSMLTQIKSGQYFTFLLCAVLLILAGCAGLGKIAPVRQPPTQDQPFSMTGRISINWQGKGYVAGFSWRHDEQHDQIALRSPLGNTVANIDKTPQAVVLQADGKEWQADTVEEITEERLGWPLPLSGLIWWIRGYPEPGVPYTEEPDGTLNQQGWAIRLIHNGSEPMIYPQRIEMRRPDLSVKIAIQQWHNE